MKYAVIFMISWFRMTMTKNKNIHQCIMYGYALVNSNTVWYLLLGKKSTIV